MSSIKTKVDLTAGTIIVALDGEVVGSVELSAAAMRELRWYQAAQRMSANWTNALSSYKLHYADPWRAKIEGMYSAWKRRHATSETPSNSWFRKTRTNWQEAALAMVASFYCDVRRANRTDAMRWQDWATNKASNQNKRMRERATA